MAINLPGPYEVVLEMTVNTLIHEMKWNCAAVGNPAIGTPASTISFQNRGGGTTLMDTAIGALWAFIRPHYNTAVTVGSVSLWKYVPGTFQKNFITASGVTLPAGSAAAAINPAHELILTMRSANGGIAKITMEETSQTFIGQIPLIANASGSITQQLAAYLISSASWVLARDDAFLFAPYRQLGGTNEAIFKKRFRTS